ncbi:MAG: protein kinase [Myxococcota bacterium]
MPPSQSTDRPPDERYEILGRIAVGGMAEIYLARDFAHDREVILKRLMPGLQPDAEFVRMFYDEANIAARLEHPNIVTIHELGELDGSLFIAMEFLDGINLRELQVRLSEAERTLPIGLGISIAISALAGLDYAHRYTDQYDRSLRVVHRDISPQNIIVTYGGETKLVDFGVAKAEGRLHQTRAGLIKGKFAYMSPEQISSGTIDGRSDLFALGEVMYEMFCGRHPFYATVEMDMLRGVLEDEPTPPHEVDANLPQPLSQIIMRAMQKMPEDRYGTAGLMKKDLERFVADSGISLNRSLLSRFVQELFRERIGQLEAAKAANNIEARIQAMRVKDAAPFPKPPVHTPTVAPDEPSKYQRAPVSPGDKTVEVSPLTVDPEPKFDTPTLQQPLADLDAGDLPTVMGELSPGEMAQLRKAAASVRANTAPPRSKTDATSPMALDDINASPNSVQETLSPFADPADRPAATRPPSKDRLHARPMNEDAASMITHRSQTVVPDDSSSLDQPDRGSLVLFAAGVIALVSAVAYAVYLFWGARSA